MLVTRYCRGGKVIIPLSVIKSAWLRTPSLAPHRWISFSKMVKYPH